MKKLIIHTKVADFKQGKFIEETKTAVVASTKSENNLIDEMKKEGVIVSEVIAKDFFLDKEKTLDGVNKVVDGLITDVETAKLVKAHLEKVLNGGCLFKPEKK